MRFFDLFRLALNSILHRKLRSWLTLLGIVIGVGAVVAIISMGEGAQASIDQQLSSFGADMITVTAGFSRAEGFGGMMVRGGSDRQFSPREGTTAAQTTTPTLKILDARVIAAIANVKNVNEEVSGRAQLASLAEKANVNTIGVNPNTWKSMSTLELASGRLLNSSDTRAIVIGNRVANQMFKQPITIGRRVTIGTQSFTVVGILKSSGSGFGGGNDSTVFMPYSSAWDVTDVDEGVFSTIEVQVEDVSKVGTTVDELTSALLVSRRVTESKKDFTVTSAESIKAQISSVSGTLTLFLAAIAAISLIVGAIGVANSMFTSVLEKTKLIGVLKALGATNSEVLMMFVIEAGLFGLLGGFFGAILGSIASAGLASVSGISLPMMRGGLETLVTPQLLVASIGLSTLIGIVSGVMPARAAANLKPVEALRYE
ncbi:MAG: ABC transporter permease [Candidatus Diapherotrites archaeon]